MKMLNIKLLLIAILASGSVKAAVESTAFDFIRNKNLPILYAEHNIYQVKSKDNLDGWTCGFFTLENARNLTAAIGLGNPCDIKQECGAYVNRSGINPLKAINNSQLTKLADDVVRVKNFYPLHQSSSGMIELMPEEVGYKIQQASDVTSISTNVDVNKKNVTVHIEAPFETSEDQLAQAAQNAMTNELHHRLVNLNNLLNQQESGILNFGCMLNPEEEHVMLISIVQFDRYNRALFVFDNLNKVYTESPIRHKFVKTLQNIFCS